MLANFLKAASMQEANNKFSVSANPSMLPANFAGDGRMVWEISMTNGVLKNGSVSETGTGLSVWDFNSLTNYYELSNFKTYTDFWGYAVRQGAAAMANRNSWIIAEGGSGPESTNTRAFAGRIDIATTPSSAITFVSPHTYRFNHPTNSPAFFTSCGDGLGVAYFGYYDSYFSSPPQSSNGFLYKIGTSNVFGQTSGGVRTGLSTSSNMQGQPAISMALTGGTAFSGHALVSGSGPDRATVVNLALSRLNTNPIQARIATVTYSGSMQAHCIIRVDSTRFICIDLTSNSNLAGRASIIFTNSATSPASITRGGHCFGPPVPAGYGFSDSDVETVSFGAGFLAKNHWFGVNKAACLVFFRLLSTSALANGNSSFNMVGLCVFTLTGTGSITATVVTQDINGKEIPLRLYGGNYSQIVASAPGNKAVLFVGENGGYTQRTIQL
jgi:hypothetical protein